MVPPPTRKIALRLTTTYAGFVGESVLLEALYKRGCTLPLVGPDLHAGDGLLMFWTHEPVAPWQTEAWLAEMRRSLRPAQYLRMIENRWVTSESSFISIEAWDRCVDPSASPAAADKRLAIYVGVDASVRHDCTAVVATTWDQRLKKVRLVWHRIYQPTPDDPLDFEQTVEATVLDLHKRFHVRRVLYDPGGTWVASAELVGRQLKSFFDGPSNIPRISQHMRLPAFKYSGLDPYAWPRPHGVVCEITRPLVASASGS